MTKQILPSLFQFFLCFFSFLFFYTQLFFLFLFAFFSYSPKISSSQIPWYDWVFEDLINGNLWNFIFAVNQTDVAFLETTQTRTYTAKLTNTDGTPYVGSVTVDLEKYLNGTASATTAVITAVNGTAYTTLGQTWTGVTDPNGNLSFTIAAAYSADENTNSVTYVRPTITKNDGDAKVKSSIAVTNFFELQTVNGSYNLNVASLRVDKEADYVYANDFKYKWDSNDQFFIGNQNVSQSAFETALSRGDEVTVDYKVKAENSSSWNITKDVTLAAEVEFTNPAKEKVTFDGFNYDLSGTAQAGHSVKVYRVVDGVRISVGNTTADSNGNWSVRAVNLAQEKSNTFEAYTFAPGKDSATPWAANSGSESNHSVVVNEGEFGSETLSLTDIGDAGLSIGDTLNFTFERSAYGHEFKKDLTGTITVADGLGQSVVVNVEYVNVNTLKVTGFATSNKDFKNNSNSLTVTAATGVVNQDQLAYNVAKSTDVALNFGGVSTGPASGSVVSAVGSVLVVGNDAYTIDGTSVLYNANGTNIAVGAANIVSALTAADTVRVVRVENGVAKGIQAVSVAKETTPATNVINLITALNPASTDFASKVASARTAYDALSDSQDDLVTNYASLVAAENQVAASTVDTAIEGLSFTVDTITLANKPAFDLVKGQFVALTDAQEALVKSANKTTLSNLDAKLVTLTPASATLTPSVTTVDQSDLTGNAVVTVTPEVKNNAGTVLSAGTAGTYTLAVPAGAVATTDYIFNSATGQLTIVDGSAISGTYTVNYANTAVPAVIASTTVTVTP